MRLRTKHLQRVGGSYGLVIDRIVMALLGITPKTQLALRIDEGSLVITPVIEHKEIEEIPQDLYAEIRRSLNTFGNLYRQWYR